MLAGARVLGVDLDVDAAVARVKIRQPGGKKLAGEERRHHDAQLAARAGRVAGAFDGCPEREQRGFQVVEQLPAYRGQQHGACAALEQRNSQLFLELFDLVTDSRGRQRQPIGRSLEARMTCREAKGSEQP